MPLQGQIVILHQLRQGHSQQSPRQKAAKAAEHRGWVKAQHTLPARQSDHRVKLVYNGLSSCQHHSGITRSRSSNPALQPSHALLCSKKDNALQALRSLLPARELQAEPKWHEIPSTGSEAVFGKPMSLSRSDAALTQSPARLTAFSRRSFPQDFPARITSLPAKFQ